MIETRVRLPWFDLFVELVSFLSLEMKLCNFVKSVFAQVFQVERRPTRVEDKHVEIGEESFERG